MYIIKIKAAAVEEDENKKGEFYLHLDSRLISEKEWEVLKAVFPDSLALLEEVMTKQALLRAIIPNAWDLG